MKARKGSVLAEARKARVHSGVTQGAMAMRLKLVGGRSAFLTARLDTYSLTSDRQSLPAGRSGIYSNPWMSPFVVDAYLDASTVTFPATTEE